MSSSRRPAFNQPRSFAPAESDISLQETITLSDIEEGRLNDKISKLTELLKLNLSEGKYILLNLNARIIKENQKTVIDHKDVVEKLNEALEKYLKYKQKVLAEIPQKLKNVKEEQNKIVQELEAALINHINERANFYNKKREDSTGEADKKVSKKEKKKRLNSTMSVDEKEDSQTQVVAKSKKRKQK